MASKKILESAQYAALVQVQTKIEAVLVEKEVASLEAIIKEGTAAVAEMVALRGKKIKIDPVEEDLMAKLETASTELVALQAAIKAAKDAARKKLQAAVGKAAPYTGDMEELKAALADAEENSVSDKELNEAREKLTIMISFQFQLKEGAKSLDRVAKGRAENIAVAKLEAAINEQKDGPVAELRKIELNEWLAALTKVPATAIATEALDAALLEAQALKMDEAAWKPFKKKNDEAKKAQVRAVCLWIDHGARRSPPAGSVP